ncbi:MAG TPA: hypothetical protein VFW94_15250, partial [Candidatus Acidoferrales bacterium]|nr:hypothetical protein [Candidatus Acidoferrales bacterium]
DSPMVNQNPQPKLKPTTARLPITLGASPGSGHFYLAQNRTFLLCVDTYMGHLAIPPWKSSGVENR